MIDLKLHDYTSNCEGVETRFQIWMDLASS